MVLRLRRLQPQSMMTSSLVPGVASAAFILGGQKSGKTRRAEQLAREWLEAHSQHKAVYLATGQAWDDEMVQRIARHQADRALRVPGMTTAEAPLDLSATLKNLSTPETMVVVDCLTMWLTNWFMPVVQNNSAVATSLQWKHERAAFLKFLQTCPGPVVVVGNEIGFGVIPLGAEVRRFVDALGVLNQDVAKVCTSVTLMVAGLPMVLK